MDRTGKYFDVILKDAHLNWGRKGITNGLPRNRHKLESYIPICSQVAKELLLIRGQRFNVYGCDFQLRVSGSQGKDKRYGKNFESAGNLKLLGEHLKQKLHLYPESKIRIEWIDSNTINIQKM
ncbi:hypothetical protein F6X86_05295 [Enterococcus durans]|uniref:Restriction endonuclease type II NgoFVII C-terminal B3-like DNA-binding domain-containing protein n=1 Tax=Enterococcus durans TaxID=53345 RepID=A0A5N0YUK7_9ENTE|nr:hypothetical protein [Enterococcus durans]KAA9179315.1 hypothetical protein F6X86_05295 [Enterococcus durans]KAA9185782.1 hypothetical protein F6X90_08985 [Enterococcus durans]KAA9186545.1 hypothetical protein F6X85_05995 [Enterococcus durans]KAA9190183.1 hypothetical protein F6Y12_08865 [Enterococcus durans]KAA9190987.1 hypothetical protein F6X87_12630 [Enterococcus durans]